MSIHAHLGGVAGSYWQCCQMLQTNKKLSLIKKFFPFGGAFLVSLKGLAPRVDLPPPVGVSGSSRGASASKGYYTKSVVLISYIKDQI